MHMNHVINVAIMQNIIAFLPIVTAGRFVLVLGTKNAYGDFFNRPKNLITDINSI